MFLLKNKTLMGSGNMVSLALSTLNLKNTAYQNLQQRMAGNAHIIPKCAPRLNTTRAPIAYLYSAPDALPIPSSFCVSYALHGEFNIVEA